MVLLAYICLMYFIVLSKSINDIHRPLTPGSNTFLEKISKDLNNPNSVRLCKKMKYGVLKLWLELL